MMETKVRVTKDVYRLIDSYNRRQNWILKELLKSFEGIKNGNKTGSPRKIDG